MSIFKTIKTSSSLRVACLAASATVLAGCESALVWEADYRAVQSTDMQAVEILVNDDLSSIIVGNASMSTSDDEVTNVSLAKLSADGVQVWTSGLNLDDWDFVTDASFDEAGNVVVVGHSGPNNILAYDYGSWLIAKFDQDGNELWSTTYKDCVALTCKMMARAVAVGPSGNIYVSGTGRNPQGSEKFKMAAWDSAGTKLWDKTEGFATSESGWDAAVAVDGANEYVFVTDPSGPVRRYTSTGANSDYSSGTTYTNLTVDSERNLVIAGGSGTRLDVLDYNLAQQWGYTIPTYTGSIDKTAVDENGDIYAAATINGVEAKDVYTFKLDGDTQAIVWDQLFSANTGDATIEFDSEDTVADLVLTAIPEVVVVVNTNRDPNLLGSLLLDNTYQYNLLKYSIVGEDLGRNFRFEYFADSVATDLLGDVYVTGRTVVDSGDELRTQYAGKWRLGITSAIELPIDLPL